MGGTHKFTSSVWIQSGSGPATFQSGISVTGNVSATRFIGDGSGLTGVGTAVFFAGSGSGISASSPSSVDHIIILDAESAISPVYRIETTSSGEFKPNHFVFVKLTNKFETLQEGSQSFYNAKDRTPGGDEVGEEPFTNDRAPGVHRYLVYATDTGSAGETHAVYTSAFIEGYVNVAPVIKPPDQSLGVVQIGHDKNSLTHILHFTESREPNDNQGDFIRVFSASRSTIDPTVASSTTAAYDLTMRHHQSDIADSDNLIATGSVDPANPYLAQRGVYGSGTANNAALPNSVLVFTASISAYDVTKNNIYNHADTIEPREERFTITMFDNWFVDHSSSLEYSMSIVPPNTASIRDVRVRVESGSFTGITTDTFSTPILYDDVATRTSVDGLDDRYTSSLVRVSVMADITEPADYEPDGNHFTDIRVNDTGGTNNPLHNKRFRFSGSTATGLFRATASGHDTNFNFNNNIPTESLGFSPFAYTAGTSTLSVPESDGLSYLRHGNHNHISAIQAAGNTTLTVRPVPDIEISNVRVEVESGSFLTGVGAFERSASVLYGFTSSLRVAETSSLEGYEKSAEYISASVVRLRLLATITEPFGPHHTKMISTLETDNSSYAHSHEFEFHTGSGAIHTASSAIAYDSHDRLVGHYTSSWINFNLKPGQYTFSASFNSDTNTGRTIAAGTYAEVSISNTPPTEITNIVYETETHGYSEEGSINAMRTVLYGVPRHTLVDSSSFIGHINAVTYASHSVSRFRVLANIREPFGPDHTGSLFQKVWKDGNDTFTSVIHFSTASTDTASSAIAYDAANRLLARYTSSWIGQQLSSSNNAANIWTYTSGSIIHAPHDLSGFTTASGLSTQLKVNDTARIQLSNRIHEFEEYGHSASNAADTGITNTIRTVLYGSDRRTLVDSSSIEGHDNTSAYASQSVSRVRMRIQITEPVGPGHGNLRFIPTLVGDRKTLNAFTNSADFESISHGYDSQKRLVANYTESWHGVEITEAPTTKTAQFDDSNTTNVAAFASKENGIILGSPTNANIEVFDTAPTQITNIRYQTETFGYSGQPSTDTTRKVLYGVAHKTNTGTGSGDTGESWSSHDSASLYASQSITRFRVLATITEPVGPLHTASKFEKVWTADNESTIRDVIHFSTASGDITASSVIGYDSSNRLVAHYTSSYIGVELASNNFTIGEQWKYTSGSILHEPQNENGFVTASGESTAITVFDTQPTVFSNFKTETETFGYSGIPIQDAFRKVLYGVAHATVADSSSFTNHDSASLYASQSVSQFRIVARITEPVGPLQHTASRIEKTFKNETGIIDGKTETIIFGTASIGFESSRSFFTEVGEFVTEYTTSFEGKVLEVPEGALAERDWLISTGSVIHNPPGENAANSSSFTATTVTVQNTDSVKIEKIFWETETHGYSNKETSNGYRTVLYGNNRVTEVDSGSYESHVSASIYASHSVSRIRFRARVTDPIGPAVNKLRADFDFDVSSQNFEIHTGSIEHGGNISFSYVNNQLVAHYTSSYSGSEFDTTAGSQKTHNLTGNFVKLFAGENALIQSDVTNGTIIVRDTEPTQIDSIAYETETHGYSGVVSTNTSRTILYGDIQATNTGTGSGESGESWSSHDSASLYASQSVSRFRVRARVIEPVGPLHTASRFEQIWTAPNLNNDSPLRLFSDNLHFSTASVGIVSKSFSDSAGRFIVEYTSSFKGRSLSSRIPYETEEGLVSGEVYTYTSGSILHEPQNENGFVTASGDSSIVRVFDTQPTQFDRILLETETFGYSGIGATSGTRKVLYGVPHHTIAGTGSVSWTGHDSASLYASQSVTQFRIKTRITEPVGPHQTGSILRQQFTSNQSTPEQITSVPAITTPLQSSQLLSGDVNAAFDGQSGLGYQASTNEILTIIFNEPQTIERIEVESDPQIDSDQVNLKVEASPDNGITMDEQENIVNNNITPTRPFNYFELQFNNTINITINEIRLFRSTFTQPIIYNNTVFNLNTDSPQIESSRSFYNEESRLVSEFTSSYFGVQLSASIDESELYQHSLSQIVHNPIGSGRIKQVVNPTVTNLRVFDTAAPKYENFKTETETHGYSNEPVQNTIRTVLYGNNQITEVDSGSYQSHVSASIYASHSVSRFRTLARIIEPVGPLQHTASRSEMTFNSAAGKTRTIVFGTGSNSFVKSFFTPLGEFVAEYTTSYEGTALESGTDNTIWTIQNQTAIHQAPGENPPQNNASATTVNVRNTEPTQIDSIAYETETHGYSGVASTSTIRKVLYGDNKITNIDSASFTGHINADVYASHSVSQFRVRARVIEPVGPLHSASRFDQIWSAGSGNGSSGTHYYLDVESFGNSDNIGTGTSDFRNVGAADWTQDTGGTPSSGTGPNNGISATSISSNSEAQSSGQGYIFTEASPAKNTVFTLRTPQLNLNQNTINEKLVLYFHIKGNNISSEPLKIYHGTSATSIGSTELDYKYFDGSGMVDGPITAQTHANQGDAFYRLECDISAYRNTGGFYLYIRSLTGNQFSSDTTIDNVHVIADLNSNTETHTNSLIFSTASVGIVSKSFSDAAGRFIVEYTSSYAGINLSGSAAGTTWTYTSASILHEPPGENSFTTASGDSSTMTVFDTENTQIRNMRIETETVGHSNIGVQNRTQADHRLITRSILYGESASFANSSSFHGLDPIFANTSVTRFRVLADIVEPLGPHHTGSLFAYTKDAVLQEPVGADPSHTVDFGEGVSNFIIFSTSSVQTASSTIVYDSQTRLAAAYTSSFFGESLSPSKVLTDGFWHIHVDTSNIHHTPIDNSGVDKSSDSSDLYMVVSASKPLTVTNLRTEVEAFPYSSSVGTVSRTEEILYGYNRTLSASDADTVGDIWSGSAAIRFRTLATITEPIGFRHFKTQFTMSNANVGERGFEFHTASLETSSRSARTLNSIGQFVTHYTSAFHDGFTFKEGTYAFTPSAKVGSDTVGLYVDADGIDVTTIVPNAQIQIDPTPKTQITNIRIETETVSGSGIGASTRETTILHGNIVTETDNSENSAYPNSLSRQQLTSVRLLADIAEPFGPHHTASIFTINGYGGTHKVRLHTGSADLSASAVQIYDQHGSASVAYTSSFVPIEMSKGVKTVTVSNIDHEFEVDRFDQSVPTVSTITVQGPTNASIFVNPQTGSQFFSSSADIDKYVTYNRDVDLVVDIISGISASAPPITSQSILTFPDHVNILYDEDDSILSFSVDNATVSGQETGSLTIVNSVMDDLTNVEFFTINVSGSGTLAGSGSSGNSPLTFAVIPAKPRSMEGMYWGAAGASSHDTDGNSYGSTGISVPSIGGNRRLYEGTLSEGIPGNNYKSGEAGGTNVTNIMMAKDSATGPRNYTMSFAPFNASNTGNYDNKDRLFDFGDSGSLIVRINGDRVVEYSLQDNFDTDRKHTTQDLSTYAGEGTASFTAVDPNAIQYIGLGRLIVTRVEPFNSVSQSIFNAGRLFPNGYQGWSARIEIDNKLKDGYNKLEFSHSIDSETTQSWQPFDWYYDDGIELPQFRSTATASLTSTGADTFALSGVDFIEPDTTFTVTFKDAISNLAAQTYRRQDGQIMETREDPSSANLTISSDGDTDGILNHKLSSTTVNKGLHFGTDVNDIVPTKFESGSLTISVQASDVSNTLTGDERFIKIHQFHRQFDGVNNFLEQFSSTGFTDQISVGRFVTKPTTDSTTTVENFFKETFRYKAASNGGVLTDIDGNAIPPRMEDFRNSSAYLGSYWINSANADFVSSENIINEPELQVHHDGALRYPKETYPSVLPSVVDYSGATGDRFYYRAFDIGSGTTAVTALKITVGFDLSNPLLLNDFITAPVSANGFVPASNNFDGAPIRIDICLPGPVAGSGINNDSTAPGTKWGVATANGTGGSPSTSPFADDWVTSRIGGNRYEVVPAGTTNFSSFLFSETVTTSNSEHVILMGMNAIDTQFTNGIVLCRVRFKSTAIETRHQITSLKIEPVS